MATKFFIVSFERDSKTIYRSVLQNSYIKLIQDGGQFVDLGENISRSKTDIKILQ